MQISFFDGKVDYCLNKPIRLIELFAGYGSQSKALEELGKWGLKFQHWKICEWAVKSIQAYKDLHFANDNNDYSKDFTFEYIAQILFENGISSNYNEPMTLEQIKRLGEKQCRNIYNNCVATHNLVNIQKCTAEKLEITDTDKYDYVLTYSFPCQDLSKAGLQKGMGKGSGTRSGMLWEVERILDELNEIGRAKLPKILLMENVPDVIGSGAIKDFAKWLGKLESLGYKCYWKILNAKDFGIPQNRERCFMISVLGDYFYGFPQTIPLTYKLVDVLETNVDEKFYLSQKAINGKLNTQFNVSSLEMTLPQKDGCCRTLCARDYKDPKCVIEPIACELRTDEGIRTFNNNVMGTLRTIDACGQKHIIEPTMKEQLRIRKLTPKECFRLMGIKDEDFEKIAKNQSNASLYHLAGDSIVVSVLVAIFGQMIKGFDFNDYIKGFYKTIKGE